MFLILYKSVYFSPHRHVYFTAWLSRDSLAERYAMATAFRLHVTMAWSEFYRKIESLCVCFDKMGESSKA